MNKKLLIHFAKDRNGGEFRRIARLSKDSDQILKSETFELVFLPIRMVFKLSTLRKNALGAKLYLVPCLLPFTRFGFISTANTKLSRLIAKIIYHIIKPDYIWGETLIGNSIAYSLGSTKYIADFHGASPEENHYFRPDEKKQHNANELERRVLKAAKAIIVQSFSMKEHLKNKHPEIDQTKIIVYNCGVNTELFDYRNVNIPEVRRREGYSQDDIIFTYVGGTNKWQMLYQTLDVFNSVRKMMPSAKCQLILQGDPTPYMEYCDNKGITDVRIVQCVPFNKVYEFISISDFAWLLRENIILNQVASPTKLGEYLSCGQVIITTDVVDSWTWLNREDVIVINPDFPQDAARRVLDFYNNHPNFSSVKSKMREIGERSLSSKNDSERLKELTEIL